MKFNKVYLLGDGTLDNSKTAIEKKYVLSKILEKKGMEVVSLCKEGTCLVSLIKGIEKHGKKVVPLNMIQSDGSSSMRSCYGESELSFPSTTSSFSSFSSPSTTSSTPVSTYSVICVGGEDIKKKIPTLILGKDNFFSSLISKDYLAFYSKFVHDVVKKTPKTILISLYSPYSVKNFYQKYDSLIGELETRWMTMLCNFGKKYDIPVINLFKTFPKTHKRYFMDDNVHLSDLSMDMLAKMISHIMKNYHGYSIYYMDEQFHVKRY